MSELTDKLTQHIHQVDEEATLKFLTRPALFQHISPVRPRYVAYVRAEEGCPTKELEIITAGEEEQTQEEWVVTLAHEAGHIEQGKDIRGRKPSPPPTELDAWRRGLKWAIKWGVVPEYARSFASDLRLPNSKDVERIRAQINYLFLGSSYGKEKEA